MTMTAICPRLQVRFKSENRPKDLFAVCVRVYNKCFKNSKNNNLCEAVYFITNLFVYNRFFS